jgi:quercetin dioxygenase-like cupin family protein
LCAEVAKIAPRIAGFNAWICRGHCEIIALCFLRELHMFGGDLGKILQMSMVFAAGVFVAVAFSQEPSGAEAFMAREIERGAPTETSGINSTVVGTIALEAYGESLVGAEFRAREVVLEPGARIAVHSHERHPAMVYVIEGEAVEHRSDSDEPLIRRAGDSYFEGPEVAHWVENVSSKPVRAFSVGIYPEGL